jgi:hypothetical protein
MMAFKPGFKWQSRALLVLAWLATAACAAPDAALPAEQPVTQPAQSLIAVMAELGETLLVILPTLHADQVDRDALQQQMLRLGQLLDKAEPHLLAPVAGGVAAAGLANDSYGLTYAQLRANLTRATELVATQNLNFVQSSLAETFEMCGGCHTQDKHARRILGISRLSRLDEFLAGEYSFLTRDYASAQVSYTNVLRDSRSRPADRQQALDRMLMMAVEVETDIAAAAAMLAPLQDLGDPTEQAQVRTWLAVLAQIQQAPAADSPLGARSAAALGRFLHDRWPPIEQGLDGQARVAYWRVIRGQLNRQLVANPDSDELPGLYYWLAVSDRSLEYPYYDSLTRRYLESCIEEHPGSAYAAPCLAEYEALVLASYAGSGGIFVPDDVQQRLDTLRRQAGAH